MFNLYIGERLFTIRLHKDNLKTVEQIHFNTGAGTIDAGPLASASDLVMTILIIQAEDAKREKGGRFKT